MKRHFYKWTPFYLGIFSGLVSSNLFWALGFSLLLVTIFFAVLFIFNIEEPS